jgi:hypothetical protein
MEWMGNRRPFNNMFVFVVSEGKGRREGHGWGLFYAPSLCTYKHALGCPHIFPDLKKKESSTQMEWENSKYVPYLLK